LRCCDSREAWRLGGWEVEKVETEVGSRSAEGGSKSIAHRAWRIALSNEDLLTGTKVWEFGRRKRKWEGGRRKAEGGNWKVEQIEVGSWDRKAAKLVRS